MEAEMIKPIRTVSQADWLGQTHKEAREARIEIYAEQPISKNVSWVLIRKSSGTVGIAKYNSKTRNEMSFDAFISFDVAMKIWERNIVNS
jgi:hypothetical protein